MTPIGQSTFTPPVTGGAPSAPPKQEIGQEEFLSLLMTQLSNQDPLNPMESEEFMNQITQMNALQQQIETNDKLDQLVLAMGSLANENAVGLVGQEVVAAGDTFPHESGASEELNFTLAEPADSLTVNIRDDSGRLVRTIEVGETGVGDGSISWDGRDTDGNLCREGDYTFEALGDNEDGQFKVATSIRGVVEELRFEGGAPVLVIGGQSVALSEVSRVLMGDRFPDREPALPLSTEEVSELVSGGTTNLTGANSNLVSSQASQAYSQSMVPFLPGSAN